MKSIIFILSTFLFFSKFTLGKVISNSLDTPSLYKKTKRSDINLSDHELTHYYYKFNTNSIDCQNSLEKYGNCIYDMKNLNGNITHTCELFESENCNKFINDIYSLTTNCEQEENEAIDIFIKQMKYIYITGCPKDIKNRLCLLSYVVRNKEKTKIAKQIELKILTESCTFENCRQQLYSMVDLISYTNTTVKFKDSLTKKYYKIPKESLIAAYTSINTTKIKEYLDAEICSQIQLNSLSNSIEQSQETEMMSKDVNFGNNLSPNHLFIILTFILII